VATPVEEEFDWANTMVAKKGQSASIAQIWSTSNAPDPDNADDGIGGGKKKRKGNK